MGNTDWKSFVLTGVGAAVVSYVGYVAAGYFNCPVVDDWRVIGTAGAVGAVLGSKSDELLRK